MSSSDVRSILDLPTALPATSASRRSQPQPKRPDGISREVYALIGDNSPSLRDVQSAVSAVKYRERPRVHSRQVKWQWASFTPAARSDGLTLRHWSRMDNDHSTQLVQHFGSFSRNGPSIMEYSRFEYDQHLAVPDWTYDETEYLFDLLRLYDLRFVIVADRYAYSNVKDGAIRHRTVEDLKDRYYTICRRLVRTRTTSDPLSQQQLIQAYSFDKEREIKRKKYASGLFHLTATEMSEEEALYIDMKRLEQNERRFRADRDDLMRTVMGLESGLVSLDEGSMDGVLGVDKSKKRKRPEDVNDVSSPVPLSRPRENPVYDHSRCIYRSPHSSANTANSHLALKHPGHQPVGVRSARMPLPKPAAAIRSSELLAELGVNAHRLVMPTRSNFDQFEGLLQAAAGLIDIKKQVDRVGQELRTLRAQQSGYVAPIENRQLRSASITSTGTSIAGQRSRV